MALNSTIVSYPERGEGGSNRYRGNCSPKLITDLIEQYHVSDICDYMAGSFTTRDAALSAGLGPESIHCYDLNHGFDLMTMEIPERPQFIFWHPPYWDMIVYSDNMYKASDVIKKYGFDPRVNDLSRAGSWEEFVKMQNHCMMKLYDSLDVGGRIACLVGDLKRKGRLYSQVFELVKPGTLEQVIIKAQHNCWSDRNTYSNRNFVPIAHEYLVILKKDYPLMVNYLFTKQYKTDVRDMNGSSWKTVVYEVLKAIGEDASLDKIYSMIDGHKKCQTNPHWKDKVRQVLGQNIEFRSPQRGIWGLAA